MKTDSETIIRICRYGHTVTQQNAKFQTRDGIRQANCRECGRASKRRYRKSAKRTLTEAKARAILKSLNEGQLLSVLLSGCRSIGGKPHYIAKPICSHNELRNFCKAHPAFGIEIRKHAARNRKESLAQNRKKKDLKHGPRTLRGKATPAKVIEVVRSSIKNVCPTIREEVQSEMFLAISNGDLRIRDVPSRVPEFVALINRRERHSVINRFGNVSLDAPITTDSTTPLVETITHGLWD